MTCRPIPRIQVWTTLPKESRPALVRSWSPTYNGHPADMDPIMAFAKARGLHVVEIGAHALGAEYKGRNGRG